ncbi:MAG: TetR/AcrR family transcriptional regulator [Actinomycetota bacterium]|nr:TetR/AcrR family transcriptional regulator [Actinomycetota bacterium]
MSTQQAAGPGPARPPSSRLERKRGRRIQEILTAAAELFGERGYDAVSLDDVADRLDVSKGSLYYYFATKDELGTAAIETLGRQWTGRLEHLAEVQAASSPARRLHAIVKEHITIAVREYPAALGLFLVPAEWPAAQQARIKALRRRYDLVFRRIIEEGLTSGDFTVTHIDPVLQCMHAAVSQAPLWCGGLFGAAIDQAIDELADTLMMLVGQRPHPRD